MDNVSADSKDEDDIAELERKIKYVLTSCVQSYTICVLQNCRDA